MNNKIKVTNENGIEFEIEVLDIFNVDGYDKDYIMYTMGEEIDENNIKVYLSILENNNGEYHLSTIEDDEEWKKVENAIDEMGDVNEKQ